MADLVFASNANPNHATPIKLRTDDVMAVVNLGYQALVGGVFAHRRNVYFKNGAADNGDPKVSMKTVWERSNTSSVPPSMATLDNLGGKPKVEFAKVSFHGTSNSSELASANTVRISVDPADLPHIKRLDAHASLIAKGAGFNGAFTISGQPTTIGEPKPLYYANLQLGADTPDAKAPRLPIAHLDPKRGAALKALECN